MIYIIYFKIPQKKIMINMIKILTIDLWDGHMVLIKYSLVSILLSLFENFLLLKVKKWEKKREKKKKGGIEAIKERRKKESTQAFGERILERVC